MKTINTYLPGLIILLIYTAFRITPAMCQTPSRVNQLQGKCLIVSDIHLNPFFSKASPYQSDPALISKLAAADAGQWESILNENTATMIAPQIRGFDANYAVLVSAIDNMYKTIP